MVVNTSKYGAVAQPPALKSVRPKLFRRASVASWGKSNFGMTRAAAVNWKELMLTVQQQKYEDRKKAVEREISQLEREEGAQLVKNRDKRRSKWLHRSNERKDFIRNWEREGRAKWNANQTVLCRYERRLLNYELAVRATAVARQCMSRARHSGDQVDGIRWFEHNLDRLGLDPGGGNGGGGGAGAGGGTLMPDKETTATFRSRLVRAVLDQKFVPSSNAETMAELRFRGITGRRGRQEREHRRVKTEVDQRRAKTEADQQRSADRRLQGMLNEGRERRELAATCWQERHDREQKAIHDKKRFADMSAAQVEAFETVFNVRSDLARERYKADSAEREAKISVLRARLQNNREEKGRRVELMCSQAVHKILDLAIVASETRTKNGGVPLPPTTWARLKRWFCSSDPFFVDEVPPESPPEPRNPVLDAKTRLESQNLDRYEGSWRLRGTLPPELPVGLSPLSKALEIAQDLAEASGNKPREAPTYGRCRHASDVGDEKSPVKIVLLGRRHGLNELCAELGKWVNLYVCSLEKVLETAMEVGAEEATNTRKGSKGRRGSASVRKSSAGGDALKRAAELGITSKEGNGQETTKERFFHPDATEEDVAAFKTAATAYHALRTNPKKAATPVPLATMTDLVVKHMFCHTPKGHGWLLVGYPTCLIESKLLENALSGYLDEEVSAELGRAGKLPKAKRGSKSSQEQGTESHTLPRSGLDAVLNLTPAEHLENQPEDSSSGMEACEESTATNKNLTEVVAETCQNQGRKDEEDDTSEGRRAQIEWWEGFDGGHLSCNVLNEANNERLLETLFLLVNAAQNRKDDHEIWLKKTESAKKSLEDEAARTLEESREEVDEGDPEKYPTTSTETIDQPSPLSVPLTTSLEDLRSERRANMSHSTRIQVEASTGDRKLDLDRIRLTLSEIQARQGCCITNASTSPPPLTAALRKFEAECQALFVVDWAIHVIFSFSRRLRDPDDRWTTACIQLEKGIADWLTRRRDALAEESNWRKSANRLARDGYNDRAATVLATPPVEEDRIWEVLEEFELRVGDVVDDRHSSAEAAMREIDDEADWRLRTWVGKIETAVADLFEVEWVRYHETVENLRTLDSLFGLPEIHDGGDANKLRAATFTAADAIATELQTMFEGCNFSSDGGCQELARRMIQEVCPQKETNSCVIVPTYSVGFSAGAGLEKQQEVLPPSKDTPTPSGEPRSEGVDTRVDEGGMKSGGNRESESLSAAIWLCRLTFICRLRGVVARLTRVVKRCEAKVMSMRASLRRLKRRRVQLEHESFSVATSLVRRAVEEVDDAALGDMLDGGIPVWIEDEETFAADPYVALSWGMSSLSLPHVMSLARALRRSVAGAEGEAEDMTVVPVPDLSKAVRAWSHSEHLKDSEDGKGDEIPQSWTSVPRSSRYIDTLCGAIAGGVDTGKASWRMLIHSLLLGHVRSLPTLDDLRFMRHAFCRKASTASRLSSPEAPQARSSTCGVESTDNVATTASSAPQTPVLRIAQRLFSGIPLWFEQQQRKGENGGEDLESDSWSSMVRAVYNDVWGTVDGRVDGMDLLLTLCAVPDDSTTGSDLLGEDEKDDYNGSDTPFPLGLFRAFYMLAEVPIGADNDRAMADANIQGSTCDGMTLNPVAAPSSSMGDTIEGDAETAGVTPTCVDNQCFPRVSLPHLRAILEHGYKMPPTDVSEVCETVARKEEESCGVRVSQPQRLESTLDRAVVEAEETAMDGELAIETAIEQQDVVPRNVDGHGDDKQDTTLENLQPHHDLPPFSVSFATVAECRVVRAWLAKGPYSLPAFDVTAGLDQDAG